MQNILYGFGILALITYILNNLTVPIHNAQGVIANIKAKRLPTAPPTYDDLSSVFRAKTVGSAPEIEPFKDFDKYTDKLWESDNYNPPSKIFTHEEDDNSATEPFIDIYEHEVAK